MKNSTMDGMRMASSSQGTPKKSLSHIEVRRAKNGGYSVTHHYESGMGAYHKPDVYAFGDGPETAAHLNDHLGLKENLSLSGKPKGYVSSPGGKADKEVASREPKYSAPRRGAEVKGA